MFHLSILQIGAEGLLAGGPADGTSASTGDAGADGAAGEAPTGEAGAVGGDASGPGADAGGAPEAGTGGAPGGSSGGADPVGGGGGGGGGGAPPGGDTGTDSSSPTLDATLAADSRFSTLVPSPLTQFPFSHLANHGTVLFISLSNNDIPWSKLHI